MPGLITQDKVAIGYEPTVCLRCDSDWCSGLDKGMAT